SASCSYILSFSSAYSSCPTIHSTYCSSTRSTLFLNQLYSHPRYLHSFPTRRSSDLLPRVARLMIHTPTAISIFVCLSMVQLMAVFISMRCTLCGHFLQVALTLILVVGYAIAAS